MDKAEPTPVSALSSDWLTWLGLAFDVGAKLDWLNVLLMSGAVVVGLLVLVAQFRKGDGFDLRGMFASRSVVDGRDYWTVEPGRVYQTGAFMFTSWGFVWVVTHDKLTETYLFVYVGLWAATRAMNQIIASKFPVAPGSAPPDQSPTPTAAVTTTTTTEVRNPPERTQP